MLAPIALYPDALLSQVLMAASYPLEVVEAQRWTVANPSLTGNAAVLAAAQANWDPSVKSLLAFPRILQTMGTQLDWTRRLGDAFLGQQQQVIDTVQALRKKAYAAGSLVSNAQSRVSLTDDYITIVPTQPQIAYEPYYDPGVVYGTWWWPQYPPMAWAPWAGYGYRDGFGLGFMWGAGVLVTADFLFGGFDWRAHHVNVDYAHFHDNRFAYRSAGVGPWEHNPNHRQGIAYRRPPPASHFAAPLHAPGFAAPVAPARVPQPFAPVTPRPHAFENIGQGRAVRNFSARGQNSVHPMPPLTAAPAPCPIGGCNPAGGGGRRAPGNEVLRPRH